MPESLSTALEKRRARARLAEQSRVIIDALPLGADGKRQWSAEARSGFDAIHTQQEALKVEIDAIEGAVDREAAQAELEREMQATTPPRAGRPDTIPRPETDTAARASTQRERAFRRYALMGADGLSDEQRQILGMTRVQRDDLPDDLDPEVAGAVAGAVGVRWQLRSHNAHADARRVWNPDTLKYEQRATDPQSLTGAAGGYSVPNEVMQAVDEALLFVGGLRNSRATVLRTQTGANLPIPTSDDTANEGEILAENTQTTTVLTVPFGQVVFGAYKYSSKFIKASIEFLQDTSIGSPETWLARHAGERLGRITNRHATKGSNSSQPYGVQWAATLGKTVASATAITFQEVIDLEHSVDPSYRQAGGEWMFNDATLAILKKLGDSTGQWIWQPGLLSRAPDRILGYEYVINQHMDGVAAGKHSMLFGDFSKYFLREVREIMVLRLVERFADYGQVAFLAFMRFDADLVNTAAIKYLRHPAS